MKAKELFEYNVKTLTHTSEDDIALQETMIRMFDKTKERLTKEFNIDGFDVCSSFYGYSIVYFFIISGNPVGFALLDRREPSFESPTNKPLRKVSLIWIRPSDRRNIAYKFYEKLLDSFNIYNDDNQTEKAQNLWKKLELNFNSIEVGDHLIIYK